MLCVVLFLYNVSFNTQNSFVRCILLLPSELPLPTHTHVLYLWDSGTEKLDMRAPVTVLIDCPAEIQTQRICLWSPCSWLLCLTCYSAYLLLNKLKHSSLLPSSYLQEPKISHDPGEMCFSVLSSLCPLLTLSSKAWVSVKASHSMHLAPRHW